MIRETIPAKLSVSKRSLLLRTLPAVLLLGACGAETSDPAQSGLVPGIVQEIAQEEFSGPADGTNPGDTEAEDANPDAPEPEIPTEASSSQGTYIETPEALSLYRYDSQTGNYDRLTEWESAWEPGQDIVVLAPFAVEEESFYAGANAGTRFQNAWKERWNAQGQENPCKIGFVISFPLRDGSEIRTLVLHPGDELAYRPYLETYLYDDIHQTPGAWYSHLEPGQETADTIISSIKLTAGTNAPEIGGEITVTAFAYRPGENGEPSPDLDDEGGYLGNRSCTVTIRNAGTVSD